MIQELSNFLLFHRQIYFIVFSSKGTGGIHGPDIHQYIITSFSSAQQVELALLIHLLWLTHKSLNIVSVTALVGSMTWDNGG